MATQATERMSRTDRDPIPTMGLYADDAAANPAASVPAGDDARERLDDIRKLSNVMQALENLIAQCEEGAYFFHLKRAVEAELIQVRQEMRRRIHQ